MLLSIPLFPSESAPPASFECYTLPQLLCLVSHMICSGLFIQDVQKITTEGQVFCAVVDMPVGTVTSHIRVPVFTYQLCSQFQLPVNMYSSS